MFANLLGRAYRNWLMGLFVVVFLVFTAWLLTEYSQRVDACEAKGGIFAKTNQGYLCIKGEKI